MACMPCAELIVYTNLQRDELRLCWQSIRQRSPCAHFEIAENICELPLALYIYCDMIAALILLGGWSAQPELQLYSKMGCS